MHRVRPLADSYFPLSSLNLEVCILRPPHSMKITQADERQHTELDLPFLVWMDRVPQDRHIPHPRQLKFFDNLHSFNFEFPPSRLIELKSTQISIPARMQ